MDTILKAFLANLGAHIGGSASDAAVECVRIATNVPSLAGCLPKDASPQTTKVEMASAPTQTITVVTPDPALPCQTVRIYFSQDVHELTRFWRSAEVRQENGRWIAEAPLMEPTQPLFAYANVVYATPEAYRKIANPPGTANSDTYFFSSRETWATPAQLKAAAAEANDKPERMICADSAAWGDWYQLNWGHPDLWSVFTR
ncbi:MAG: hypothetical protein EBT97_11790, partial [Actinobacteria bacterium]|nr:hypothetical protein [Actinomycetota bacterium]